MRALVWFRNDLRMADNPALHEATRRADRGVVAAYAVCPEQWRAHDAAPIRIDFVLRSLASLSRALAAKNIALKIIRTPGFAGVPGELARLAGRLECDAIFHNREYEVNERRRDEAVRNALGDVRAFTDQCLFEPGELRTGKGRYYTVFTPFRHAWCRELKADPDRGTPLAAPARRKEMVGEPDAVPDRVDGFEPASSERWPAGEPAALKRLDAFIRDGLDAYHLRRDQPAAAGTSELSPYLACGAISLRRCLHAAREANDGRLDTGSPGAVQWISELAWREFYKHVVAGFPRVCMYRAFRPATERVPWIDNDDHFHAWCEGRTGYPIVDAAMRQLVQTGWMHNRLRMITAMFLSKNLLLDWRRGERFFMQHLVDGDLSANNGGWQWSASTGTDAVPYFRIFNPRSQSRRFDPGGVFIRRFVPELAGAGDDEIHEPPSGPDYPEPVVDYRQTRVRAIEAFKGLS